MVHTQAGASMHAPTQGSGPAPLSSPCGLDKKSGGPPAMLALGTFGETVLQPWLKERKAQNLRGGQPTPQELTRILTEVMAPKGLKVEQIGLAVRSICRALPQPLPAPLLQAIVSLTRTVAEHQEGFDFQVTVARAVLERIAEPHAGAARDQHLKTLLQAVLALDEDTTQPPILFTAWYHLATQGLGASRVIPFLLGTLRNATLPSADAILNLTTRIALQEMHELHDQPQQVLPQLGQVMSWLLRQPAPVRAQGLAGLGMGLGASRFFEPRHLCEMLQAVAGLRDEIHDADCARDIQRMVDEMSGGGFSTRQATSVVRLLDERSAAGSDRIPPDEAMATLAGMFIGALHPQLTPEQVQDRLPLWPDLLGLPCLDTTALAGVGQSLGKALGGATMAPAVLRSLVQDLAEQAARPQGGNAFLQGLVQGAGGAAIDDARLAAVTGALAQASASTGAILTLALADAVGALGTDRAHALPALRGRLERLHPGAALPEPLRIGLGLATDPLGTIAGHIPPASQAACIEAACAQPGLLDDATLSRQLWACTLLAATDTALVLQFAGRLIEQAGSRITPAAFRELRAALLPQVQGDASQAMADLYRRFTRHGQLDEPVAAAPPRKAGGKGFGRARHATGARRSDGALTFLREEIALLSRGLAGKALAPLVRSLETIERELASPPDRKR